MQDGKHVILCIDDDPDILETLQLILDAHGYKVVQAACAEDGLKVFKSEKPDLVIVDLMMEEIDSGTNFVKDVKLLGTDDVPIYMFSSMGDSLAMATSYTDLGLAGVLQKPVQPKMLVQLIESKLKS
ncbi:MAG: response regulator [Deltaproteobacteria bacterium]|nr:response regulator [Deltaproteobacteria bacterium]